MKQNKIKVKDFFISNELPFTLIAGPCAMESEEHSLMLADAIQNICTKLGINYVFKASFDKANRMSIKSGRGIGIDKSLPVFKKIKEKIGCAVLTDFHEREQFKHEVANVVDIIQTPAFLCRQTDLLVDAAKVGKPINIKKGQFMAPWDMVNLVNKVLEQGNDQIMLCDRGTSFGYNTLVSDATGLAIMAEQTGCPIVIDATHSIQKPGGLGNKSGGNRELAKIVARSGIAVGISAVFLEVHQDPDTAPSDGPNMVKLENLEEILKHLVGIDKVIKNY